MSEKLPAIQSKQLEAVNLVEKYRGENALVFVNNEDLKTHPLFVPEITLLKVEKKDFHIIQGKFMPKSHIADRIGEASGVSFVETGCSTRTESDHVYVGRAQGKKRMPDGTWRISQAHEYEFDVEVRAELDFNGKQADKYQTDKSKKLHKLELKKFARQRSGTGARLKVIKELVGMATSFEPREIETGQMVFCRVAVNTQEMLADPEMRRAAIKHALGATEEIFGPSIERNVTPEKEALPAPEETDTESESEQQKLAGILDDDIPWKDSPKSEPPKERVPTEQEVLRSWFEERIAEVPAEDTKTWLRDFLAGKLEGKDSQDVEVLKNYKEALERKLKTAGGKK